MITTGTGVGGGRDTREGDNVNHCRAGGGNGVGSHHLTGGLKKGPWTAAEDAMLAEYVRTYGEGNWNAVQKHSGLVRCGKSCRLRWANHLRPNLRKGAFSPEEERLIIELHAKLGNKWARMAALLPGRTDNEIKNYWNTRVKRHQRQGLPLYPPHLQNNHHYSSASITPASSFTFQSPNTPTPHTPLSPNSSPSTNNTTLPLLDFSLPKTPPILQTPLRFKRYKTSVSDPCNGNGNGTGIGIGHFSLPFSPLSVSPASQSVPYCFTPGLVDGSNRSSSEFHNEMARENQKFCSLFAAVTQNQMQMELPSNQYMQSTLPQNNWDSGLNVGFDPSSNDSKFGGRKMNKRKYSEIGGSELMESGTGFLEDFFAEAKTPAANGIEQDYFVFDEQKPRSIGFDEFSKSWDPSNSLTLSSSELKSNMEVSVQQDDAMAEDLTKLLNSLPTSMPQDLYSDSGDGDISNGQSSVITEDNIDYEMQLLFPTTADQSRTLSSWDTLPRIC